MKRISERPPHNPHKLAEDGWIETEDAKRSGEDLAKEAVETDGQNRGRIKDVELAHEMALKENEIDYPDSQAESKIRLASDKVFEDEMIMRAREKLKSANPRAEDSEIDRAAKTIGEKAEDKMRAEYFGGKQERNELSDYKIEATVDTLIEEIFIKEGPQMGQIKDKKIAHEVAEAQQDETIKAEREAKKWFGLKRLVITNPHSYYRVADRADGALRDIIIKKAEQCLHGDSKYYKLLPSARKKALGQIADKVIREHQIMRHKTKYP